MGEHRAKIFHYHLTKRLCIGLEILISSFDRRLVWIIDTLVQSKRDEQTKKTKNLQDPVSCYMQRKIMVSVTGYLTRSYRSNSL